MTLRSFFVAFAQKPVYRFSPVKHWVIPKIAHKHPSSQFLQSTDMDCDSYRRFNATTPVGFR